MSISVDLLLLGGTVHTGARNNGPVDAVAVKNGRILTVGRADELGTLDTRRKIDLNGKTLIPGLIDAHNHLSWYSQLLRLVDCRLPLNGDIGDVLERIHLRVKELAPGDWVRA